MSQYSEEIKTRACELYLECGNASLVKRTLEEEYVESDERIPTSATIRNWIQQNNLPELKDSIYTDSLKAARAKNLEESLRRREYVKDNMQKAFDTAADSVFGADAKEFRSGLDAVRAMEIAAEMERKISAEQLNYQFLEDVFVAIRKVIRDDNVMAEIGREMLQILSRYGDGP